jgi:hypothetical protein
MNTLGIVDVHFRCHGRSRRINSLPRYQKSELNQRLKQVLKRRERAAARGRRTTTGGGFRSGAMLHAAGKQTVTVVN